MDSKREDIHMLEELNEELVKIPAGVTEAQVIKETRRSDRIQEKVIQETKMGAPRKRTIEGTNFELSQLLFCS